MSRNMKKYGATKKRNKIIQVRNGFLEFDPEAYLSGIDDFLKVYKEECDKRIHESELINWAPVNCLESQKKIMAAFDRLFGEQACEKVFGKDAIPSFDNFNEFLEKLSALTKKWWG